MKKHFAPMGGFWLGYTLSAFCDIGLDDIRWWIIVIPILLLFVTHEK